jgi:sugar phosphate isomerase/epimerase
MRLDQTPELLQGDSPRLGVARKKLEQTSTWQRISTLHERSRLAGSWSTAATTSARISARMDAAVARIARAAEIAERKGVKRLLENLNPEPAAAEVHYLANDLEECRYYFDRLSSPALGWSFTVNHAHIKPNKIDAFIAGLDMRRCGEVRLADCRGTHEEHLRPGEGSIDFPAMFAALAKKAARK